MRNLALAFTLVALLTPACKRNVPVDYDPSVNYDPMPDNRCAVPFGTMKLSKYHRGVSPQGADIFSLCELQPGVAAAIDMGIADTRTVIARDYPQLPALPASSEFFYGVAADSCHTQADGFLVYTLFDPGVEDWIDDSLVEHRIYIKDPQNACRNIPPRSAEQWDKDPRRGYWALGAAGMYQVWNTQSHGGGSALIVVASTRETPVRDASITRKAAANEAEHWYQPELAGVHAHPIYPPLTSPESILGREKKEEKAVMLSLVETTQRDGKTYVEFAPPTGGKAMSRGIIHLVK